MACDMNDSGSAGIFPKPLHGGIRTDKHDRVAQNARDIPHLIENLRRAHIRYANEQRTEGWDSLRWQDVERDVRRGMTK